MHVMGLMTPKNPNKGYTNSHIQPMGYFISIEYVAPMYLALHKFNHKLDFGIFGYGPYWTCDQNLDAC
jgi:hypothetical protein